MKVPCITYCPATVLMFQLYSWSAGCENQTQMQLPNSSGDWSICIIAKAKDGTNVDFSFNLEFWIDSWNKLMIP